MAAAELLPAEGRILDLGSGGGLPGLPLLMAGVGRSWVLLDGSVRRAAFLTDAIRSLGLSDRAEVLATRAEEAGREPHLRGSFDAVIARSFGPPAVTAECGAPFLALSGILVVAEPPGGRADRWPRPGLALLGLVPGQQHQLGATYQTLTQIDPCPDRFPRRTGVPAKRPLF